MLNATGTTWLARRPVMCPSFCVSWLSISVGIPIPQSVAVEIRWRLDIAVVSLNACEPSVSMFSRLAQSVFAVSGSGVPVCLEFQRSSHGCPVYRWSGLVGFDYRTAMIGRRACGLPGVLLFRVQVQTEFTRFCDFRTQLKVCI